MSEFPPTDRLPMNPAAHHFGCAGSMNLPRSSHENTTDKRYKAPKLESMPMMAASIHPMTGIAAACSQPSTWNIPALWRIFQLFGLAEIIEQLYPKNRLLTSRQIITTNYTSLKKQMTHLLPEATKKFKITQTALPFLLLTLSRLRHAS